MTFYERTRARQLELARLYREKNRAEINRKQRERYASNEAYRQYQLTYQADYHSIYGYNRSV